MMGNFKLRNQKIKDLGVFFLFLICFSNLGYNQNVGKIDCAEFKVGTFEMYVDTLRIISERNLDFQIERTVLGTSKYKIFWKSDCEYDLKLVETDFEVSKSNIGRIYNIRVISTKDDKYTYECRIEGTDFVDRAVFKKIETL